MYGIFSVFVKYASRIASDWYSTNTERPSKNMRRMLGTASEMQAALAAASTTASKSRSIHSIACS